MVNPSKGRKRSFRVQRRHRAKGACLAKAGVLQRAASVRIESKGEQAVITGDSIHHPCQMQEQTWECPADWNREIAEATRKNMLGEYADANVLVFGTHFASPSAGRVKREKDHFILVV